MGYLDDMIAKSKTPAQAAASPAAPKKAVPKPAVAAPKPTAAAPVATPTPTPKPAAASPTPKSAPAAPAAAPTPAAPAAVPTPTAPPAAVHMEPIPMKPEQVPKDIEKQAEEDLPPGKELIVAYGVAKIYRLPNGRKRYIVPVPKPSGPERQILDTLKEAATRLITVSPEEIKNFDERRQFFKKRILEIMDASPELGVSASKLDFYAETVVREMIGYGPLDLLLQDDKLEEIMVLGPNRPVYVFHRDHDMIQTNVVFGRDDDIRAIIDRIARNVGRSIDVKNPLLDARLLDGSRVNATIPPISLEGSTITIRKFREDPFTVIDLIKFKTMSSEVAAFLWLAVEGMSAKPANIIVSGGTGSGKTTTLNVLAAYIPRTERIITMEDTAEIKLPVEHWIRFETRPPGIEGAGEVDMDTLVKNSLRMRPDRVVVGEVRGHEAATLFTAMNTGHDGSLGTVHANDARETIVRLTNPPMNVPQLMLSALNLIIVQKRIHDRRKGTIRRLTEIAEVTNVLEGKPELIFLFEWDPATDTIKSTGVPSKFLQELSRYTGASHVDIQQEIKKRKEFLDKLVSQDVRGISEVSGLIHEFIG